MLILVTDLFVLVLFFTKYYIYKHFLNYILLKFLNNGLKQTFWILNNEREVFQVSNTHTNIHAYTYMHTRMNTYIYWFQINISKCLVFKFECKLQIASLNTINVHVFNRLFSVFVGLNLQREWRLPCNTTNRLCVLKSIDFLINLFLNLFFYIQELFICFYTLFYCLYYIWYYDKVEYRNR